jgi:hypothetical protein
MKGFTFRLFAGVLLILTFNVVARASDGQDAPTWKATGKYDAGDMVQRNPKLGGSVGPFFNLTGNNAGDPVYDTTNWYYCCGTVVYPPPASDPPPTFHPGSTTGMYVQDGSHGQIVAGYSGSDEPCSPLDGVISLAAAPSFPNTVVVGEGCTSGGLSTQAQQVVLTSFTATISPALPSDGSKVYVFFVYVTPDGTQTFGPSGSGGNSPWCVFTSANSKCTVPLNDGSGSVAVPAGAYVGVMYQYNMGSLDINPIDLKTVAYSVQ